MESSRRLNIIHRVCFKMPFLLLMATVLSTVAYSADPPELSIRPSTDEISPGDSIDICLELTSGDSLVSLLVYLNYDQETFGYIDGSLGTIFKGSTFADIHSDTNGTDLRIYLMAVLMGAGRYFSAPGELFSLKFVSLDTGEAVFNIDSLIIYDISRDKIDGISDSLIAVVTPDTFPPDPVTDFKHLAGSEKVFLEWRNPNDVDFQGTVVFRSEERYLDSVSTADYIAYDGNEESYTDETGLVNNTLYYYTAFAYDEIPNYSTPVYLMAEPKEELVYAYPNPFNPDEFDLNIKVVFPNDAFIDITIFDAVGNLVKELASNYQVFGGEENVFHWDGKNGNGDKAANGVYYYVVKSGQGADRIDKVAILR